VDVGRGMGGTVMVPKGREEAGSGEMVKVDCAGTGVGVPTAGEDGEALLPGQKVVYCVIISVVTDPIR
jgi:hypothetical protein